MDVELLEAEAKATAAKHVANLLQRADQLEKVEQYRKRVGRKKAAVEAMLKTAMQSQLDGVLAGLNQFQLALQDLKDIKINIHEIEETLVEIPNLSAQLKDVKKENIKHSQYAAAMENLKHIFTVPDTVERTQACINDGKLLQAHQWLSDLENSRDDLLFELHKLPNQNPTDINMLKHYFADVEKLSNMLAKQLWLILKRTLNTVRKEPTVIVTALRIIEREERIDQFAINRQKQSQYLPPGRPKQWRTKAFEVLEEAVQERVEGNQFEERKDAKMWLVRHLEVTRQLVLEDLRVIKTLCIPCFPPEYDIFNKFVKMYHGCLSRHLQEIYASGLEGNELVSLLTWLNTYEGPELLGHPDLNMDSNKIEALLDKSTIESINNAYLEFMKQNYEEWMKKTLDTDIQDWYRDTEPEADGEGYFNTVVPVIVFQMIDQNLQVAGTVGGSLVSKVLLLSMKQVLSFGEFYKEAVIDFKSKYFEDRSKVKFFTHYMIAIVNNCLHFTILARQLKNRFWKPGVHDIEMGKTLEEMINTFEHLRLETAGYLLEEVFLDLESHFQELMTRKWLGSGVPIDTICCTIEDYCNDYRHLHLKNFDHVMFEAQMKICKAYITAILHRRISFKNYDERRFAAEKIIKESEQVKNIFNRLVPGKSQEATCDIMISLAEVLKVQDTEFLSLELSGMVRKYTDMTQDHLIALLSFRGDIGRTEVKQLVSEIIPERRDVPKTSLTRSLFSEIQIPSGGLNIIGGITS